MDGDGGVYVNHSRHRTLRYRLYLNTKNTAANAKMLALISSNIGGVVRENTTRAGKCYVSWWVESAGEISRILKVFDQYPPLTSRLLLQLRFLRTMQQQASDPSLAPQLMQSYNALRATKFADRALLVRPTTEYSVSLPYYRT